MDTCPDPATDVDAERLPRDAGEVFRFESVPLRADRAVPAGGFSLNLADGEFVVVEGEPATGKSALVALASGSVPPDDGRILLRGIDLRAWPEELRRQQIACIGQCQVLERCFTVEALLSPPHRLASGIPVDPLLAAESAMTLTDTLHLRGRRILELDEGERRRVAAACLVARVGTVPDTVRLLILDDPLAGFDPGLQMVVAEWLGHLSLARGFSVLITARDAAAFRGRADRILSLGSASTRTVGSVTH